MEQQCTNCGRLLLTNVQQPLCRVCAASGVQQPQTEGGRWVRLVRMLRKPEDKGVGDTVQRIAAKFGGERFKAWSKRIGIPCGCAERQKAWNERWPYG